MNDDETRIKPVFRLSFCTGCNSHKLNETCSNSLYINNNLSFVGKSHSCVTMVPDSRTVFQTGCCPSCRLSALTHKHPPSGYIHDMCGGTFRSDLPMA